jgi:predicted DNA-binding ribbon-helix-helix protein
MKRSVVLHGRKTSVALETKFWEWLKIFADRQEKTLSALLGQIDHDRRHGNLSSAIRLYVLDQVERLIDVRRNPRIAQPSHQEAAP